MFQNLSEFVSSGTLIGNQQIAIRVKDKAPRPFYGAIPFLNECTQKRPGICIEALHCIVTLITDVQRVSIAVTADPEGEKKYD